MNKLYVISKSDLKKLSKGKLSNNRRFSVLNGEELDLEKIANDNLPGNHSFAVLNKAELDLDERVKSAGSHSSIHLYFAMLYLGLFIGFLIALIAVDMPSRKHMVFIGGTILFGAVTLFLFILWWIITKRNGPDKQMQELSTCDDTVQFD